jgi:exopolyphosphatase/guanosine-5'-triphosphate,3'-diphosphate pyrophosphatase
LLDHHAVDKVRVVATSAARDAENAEEFQRAVTGLLGVGPEILVGEEEGRLSFVGATARLPVESQRQVLVVDIGGGSTELATGTRGATGEPSSPIATTSLNIGCVRVSERFLRHDPPTDDDMAAARSFVKELVATARDDLGFVSPGALVVGLAGTVSTLACLELGIKEYDRARIHHCVLSRVAVERWLHALSSETSRARLEHPGMVPGREDVIVGGALILSVVLETFGCDSCLVSEDDILDGLVADLRARDRTGESPGGD